MVTVAPTNVAMSGVQNTFRVPLQTTPETAMLGCYNAALMCYDLLMKHVQTPAIYTEHITTTVYLTTE